MITNHPRPFKSGASALQLGLFLAGTFGAATALAMSAAASGGLGRNPQVIPLSMLTPMLFAMLIQKASGRPILGDRGLGVAWGRLSFWVWGPLAVAVFAGLATALSLVVTPTAAASATEVVDSVTHHLSVPHNLPFAAQLALAAVAVVLVGPLLNLPLFLGEEIGWRGFMNPRLTALFGSPGLIVGGVIWAFWHLPMILLGHNYPQHPWLGMAVWTPICICLNILLQHLRQSSRSIFPSALAHGVLNQLGLILLVIFMRESAFLDWVDGPSGLVGLAVLLPTAIWSYRALSAEQLKDARAISTSEAAAAYA